LHSSSIVLNGLDKLLAAETSNTDSFTIVSIRKPKAGSSDEEDDEEKEGEGTQEDNGREDDGEFMVGISQITSASPLLLNTG